MDYAEKLKKARIRIAISVATYLVFAVGAVVVIVTGQEEYTKYLLVPLVAAVLILPRRLVPIDFDGQVPASQKEAAETLLATRRWLTWTRAVYFFLAMAILFGLPELIS